MLGGEAAELSVRGMCVSSTRLHICCIPNKQLRQPLHPANTVGCPHLLQHVSTTSLDLLAGLAAPDANCYTLDSKLQCGKPRTSSISALMCTVPAVNIKRQIWTFSAVDVIGTTTYAKTAKAAAYLAAEIAEVLGVLADLHLLDLLTETRTIASPVLANNANLLCAL